MSILELDPYARPSSRRTARADPLGVLAAWFGRRRRDRDALDALAGLEPRLLVDIGFVPSEVYAAAGEAMLPRLPDRAPG